MISNKKIAVVVPCYKVTKQIKAVLLTIPSYIDFIIVVDDECPEVSGNIAKELNQNRIHVIYHEKNQGVGGAVISGFKKALEFDVDIVIKMDGDGQMDPKHIPELVQPLIDNHADYAKGNRFYDFKALKKMPRVRLFGNSLLSFIVKVTSGYWNLMDPTNGYCAITIDTLQALDLDKIEKRYFFEIDMLINLNLLNKVIQDIPMPAIYEDEESSLRVSQILYTFPMKILRKFVKRIFFKYYIYNFNMASIYLPLSILLLLSGFVLGVYNWSVGILENEEKSAGTIMLSALPIILGMQFLLQAVGIDIDSSPKRTVK